MAEGATHELTPAIFWWLLDEGRVMDDAFPDAFDADDNVRSLPFPRAPLVVVAERWDGSVHEEHQAVAAFARQSVPNDTVVGLVVCLQHDRTAASSDALARKAFKRRLC